MGDCDLKFPLGVAVPLALNYTLRVPWKRTP
jgi:hypothetical protein